MCKVEKPAVEPNTNDYQILPPMNTIHGGAVWVSVTMRENGDDVHARRAHNNPLVPNPSLACERRANCPRIAGCQIPVIDLDGMGQRFEKPKHESTRTIEELSNGEVKKDRGVKDLYGLCDKSKRFTANYDDHTVRMLMKVMLEEGYRNKKKMKKTMEEFFDGVVEKAWKIYKIRCSGRRWRDKYSKLKKEYEKYRREVTELGGTKMKYSSTCRRIIKNCVRWKAGLLVMTRQMFYLLK